MVDIQGTSNSKNSLEVESNKFIANPKEKSPSSLLLCTESFNLDDPIESLPESPSLVLSEPCEGNLEYIKSLQLNENFYQPLYQATKTPPNEVEPYMRSMLINEMQFVSSIFRCTRECFHTSVNLIDRLISKDPDIKRENLQLYGIVAIYLASQVIDNDDRRPSFLLETTDNFFTLDEFKKVMQKSLRTLEWRLTPVTRYNILLYTLKGWDKHIEKYCAEGLNERLASSGQVALFAEYFISFLDKNMQSEQRLNKILNVLDVASLHSDINRYCPSVMIAGLVYVVLNFYLTKTGFNLIGFDPLSSPLSDCVFQETANAFVLNFLSGYLNLPSIDSITTPVSFFCEFLVAPDSEPCVSEQVLYQPFNKSLLSWLQSNNLRIV